MKDYNWILALLCLAASPLNANTVDTYYDTDSMLSRHGDSDALRSDAGGVRGHAIWSYRAAGRAGNIRPFRHEDSDASDRDARYSFHRILRSYRKSHFTESFEIEKAGTYQIYLEDLDHEVLPIDFDIKFTSGYDYSPLDFKKNENGFLFEAMPGEYEISIRANGDHKFDMGKFNVHVAALGAATVPNPAAAWLFGSGLLGLTGIARRKKQATWNLS